MRQTTGPSAPWSVCFNDVECVFITYDCIITLLTKVLKISQFGLGYGFNSVLFDFSIVPTRVETVP